MPYRTAAPPPPLTWKERLIQRLLCWAGRHVWGPWGDRARSMWTRIEGRQIAALYVRHRQCLACGKGNQDIEWMIDFDHA